MRITKLSLTNFRSFKETQTIDFAPVTLLFGPNSVGKSSILMALFYLQQIIQNGECNPQRLSALGNKLVGGFKNLVAGRDLSKSIVIRVDYDKQGEVGSTYCKSLDLLEASSTVHEVSLLLQGCAIATERVGLEFVISWSKLKKTAYVENLKVWLNDSLVCETRCDESLSHSIISSLNFAHTLLLPTNHEQWLMDMMESGAERLWFGWKSFFQNQFNYFNEQLLSQEGLISQLQFEINNDKQYNFSAIAGALPKTSALLKTSINHNDAVVTAIINEALSEVLISPLDNLLSILNDSVCIGPLRCIPDSNYQPSQYPQQSAWYDGRASWDELSTPSLMRDAKINEWLVDKDKLNLGYQLVYVTEESETRFIKPSFDIDTVQDAIAINDAVPGQLLMTFSKEDLNLNPDAKQTNISSEYVEELRKSNDLYSKLYVGQEINKVSSISLWDNRNNISVSSSDIGVGISQLLPLVVASLSHRNGIIACEQPELHIHPKVQIAVGDLLLSNCNEKTFLIETHSENLVLRILRRVRESNASPQTSIYDPINPDEIAILYLESSVSGVRVKKLAIDKSGDFENDWPHGFFDERDEELF